MPYRTAPRCTHSGTVSSTALDTCPFCTSQFHINRVPTLMPYRHTARLHRSRLMPSLSSYFFISAHRLHPRTSALRVVFALLLLQTAPAPYRTALHNNNPSIAHTYATVLLIYSTVLHRIVVTVPAKKRFISVTLQYTLGEPLTVITRRPPLLALSTTGHSTFHDLSN